MKRNVLIALAIVSGLMLVSCGSNGSKSTLSGESSSKITELEEKVRQLENELSNKDISLNYLMDEKDYYRAFIDKMLSKMNERELIDIAKSEWSYSLRIQTGKLDNFKAATNIPGDGIVKLDDDSFGLVLTERQPAFPVLKDNMETYSKGAVSGKYTTHLQILDYTDYQEYPAAGTVVEAMMYYFEAVPEGTVIRVKVTDELKERLGLDSNIISIAVAESK